jgi:hypothetical protein
MPDLPLDPKKIRHALIKLLLGTIAAITPRGHLQVRTFVREEPDTSPPVSGERPGSGGASIIGVEFEDDRSGPLPPIHGEDTANRSDTELLRSNAFEGMVIRKVVELFGGDLEVGRGHKGARLTVSFKKARIPNQPP